MQGPPGVELTAMVGNTDRGTLWRASRQRPNDRIVLVIDPRFTDGAFRQALAGLGQRQPAGMVEIAGHDWTRDGRYYVEYVVDPGWRTLAERLTELADWQDRVALLERVCSLFQRWQRSPVHPLGLNPHNVVVVAEEDRWLPWLVPCPAITLATPCDLFGVDTLAIAALAPEIVRGMRGDNKAVDSYALGALVAQALGDSDMPSDMTDEDRVEAQARGMLWPPVITRPRIPTTLLDTQAGKDLLRTVEHYRQTAPSARPANAEELRSALATMADLVPIARQLRETDPVRALDVLRWVSQQDKEAYVRACLLGSEIAGERNDHEAAVSYLNEAVTFAPRRSDLRHRRYAVAWPVFESLPPGRHRQQVGEAILDDIALLKQTAADDDTTLEQRAAEVHLLGGNPAAAARELHAALTRDWSDLSSLWLYCRCWLEIEHNDKDNVNARQTDAEARRRIDLMLDAQELTTGEAQQWRERFDELWP